LPSREPAVNEESHSLNSETSSENECLSKIVEILDIVKDLLVLQCNSDRDQLRKGVLTVFGKSQLMRDAYTEVDSKSSSGEIAERIGYNSKNVSTALTTLYNRGFLQAVEPYKRGFIYGKKKAYQLVNLDQIIQDTIELQESNIRNNGAKNGGSIENGK
jgi:predicted DNA-binding transcriptional regulator